MRWLMAAAFVVTWSSGFVGAALADESRAGLPALLAWRYLATAAVLVLPCVLWPAWRRHLAGAPLTELARQAVAGLLAHVAFLGGVFLAAERGLGAGLLALVCALQPMLVAAGGRLFFGDRLGWAQWTGLGLGIGGVAIGVNGPGAATADGFALVTAAVLGLSASALLERRWPSPLPVPVSLTVQVLASTLVFMVGAAVTTGIAVRVSAPVVTAVVWLIVMSGLGGYATFIWCLRHLGATHTSTLLYLTPGVTMLWAWTVLGQRPTPVQWLGLVTVLGGVALTLARRPPAGRRADQPGTRHTISG
ncbi:DMT family transporter [Actinomycetota bacterium]